MQLFIAFLKSFIWISMSTNSLDTSKIAEYAACVATASVQTGIDPALMISIITHESKWKENAISPTRDHGLGQIRCPSKWCAKSPSKQELDILLTGCSNIRVVADFLTERGLKGYNPGSPTHAESVMKKRSRLLRIIK